MNTITGRPSGPNGPGRPRHTGRSGPLDPREEILAASAHLFVTQGFTRTSTREIAEVVGMRQASLYYHFEGGKDQILAELLNRTVRPTLDRIAEVEQLPAGPSERLYLLALLDIETLRATAHNTAFLARLPEVINSEAYVGYKAVRRQLSDAYDRLGRELEAQRPDLAPTPLKLGRHLLETVESVIDFRRRNAVFSSVGIAASCLRICGASTNQITRAAATAEGLLGDLKSA